MAASVTSSQVAGTWFSLLPRELVAILWFWPPTPPLLTVFDSLDDTMSRRGCGCLSKYNYNYNVSYLKEQCEQFPRCLTDLCCLRCTGPGPRGDRAIGWWFSYCPKCWPLL